MNCLCSPKHWDRGFESHSRHGCLCAFILCLCCPVCRWRPCEWLIPRPRSPTDCVEGQETEKRPSPTKGSTARDIDRKIDQIYVDVASYLLSLYDFLTNSNQDNCKGHTLVCVAAFTELGRTEHNEIAVNFNVNALLVKRFWERFYRRLHPYVGNPVTVWCSDCRLRDRGCCHLPTLVPRSLIFLTWRWRQYDPPKRRFKQDLHGATSQKTAFS
jgi:hypothetical protein